MQRMVRQYQSVALLRRQPIFHEGQIQVLIAAVEFVSHDGVADVSQMNADLVFPPCLGLNAEECEGLRAQWRVWTLETVDDFVAGAGLRAVLPYAVLYRYAAFLIFA